jgi:hypothetical protein
MDNKYPKFVVGAFIFNNAGELFLRTTPNQANKYTCINGKVEWGKTIAETLAANVKEKTNLEIKSWELIGLTDGLNISNSSDTEIVNLIFADYRVSVDDISKFKSDSDRQYQWLVPSAWLNLGEDNFGPYIYEIIKKLN